MPCPDLPQNPGNLEEEFNRNAPPRVARLPPFLLPLFPNFSPRGIEGTSPLESIYTNKTGLGINWRARVTAKVLIGSPFYSLIRLLGGTILDIWKDVPRGVIKLLNCYIKVIEKWFIKGISRNGEV